MPSRASAAGAGSFSYYDHVFLPESEKDLVWALEGTCYRSQVVIRLNGRRRTEAFLTALSEDGSWRPVRLHDGTVSDGKVETYSRCVEHLCGSADTFFTSVFGAQGKRPLSDYRNGEIKTLLAELLGQEEIRELGRKAGDVAKLLRAGLLAVRQEAAAIDAEAERLEQARAAGAAIPARVAQAQAALVQTGAALQARQQACARLAAQRDAARGTDARRAQLQAERRAAELAARATLQDLADRETDAQRRLERIGSRAAQRAAQKAQQRDRLNVQQNQYRALLARERAVRSAVRRLPLAERVLSQRASRVSDARDTMAAWEKSQAELRVLAQRVEGIEREAGQAALQAQALARRFGLSAQVPCSGMPLQERCQLLTDAREAQALIPSAEAVLRRLAQQKSEADRQADAVKARARELGEASARLVTAEHRLECARQRASRLALLAAKDEDMRLARLRLEEVRHELAQLEPGQGGEDASAEARAEQEEREGIAASLRAIAVQRAEHAERLRQTLARLDKVLETLPAPFDERSLSEAEAARDRAAQVHQAAQRTHAEAVREAERLAALRVQSDGLSQRRAVARRRGSRIESEIGDWVLLSRGMSNDGLIALAIDDAGPALAGLANELLLACHGPRFTVSILTLGQTAKGDKREEFDILVHDAESGESKSMRLMSAGERVWINECLVRAVALYLAQTSERRYDTLFSDEADGALDPERKRMFGRMKREVLRLGGYRREFFVSQTPELSGMADAIIDLDALRADGSASMCSV